MSRLSSAAFVAERGWGVGAILVGSAIRLNGQLIEQSREFQITAIGESLVLGRTRISGEGPGWGRETTMGFDAREWTLRPEHLAELNVGDAHGKCMAAGRHICQEPSGRRCATQPCGNAAGTWWGPYWCPEHDKARLDQVGRGFASLTETTDRA